MEKDDIRPLLMPVCNNIMESQCWGADEPFAKVGIGQGDRQAKDPEMIAEPRSRA